MKLVATSLWLQLAFSDSAGKLEGELLTACLQRLSDWLFDERLEVKQTAVYLLAQMSFKISDY